MDTTIIRRRLHSYLEAAGDKKIKAIYTLIESEIKENNNKYPDELKSELDKRYADYKSGKSKIITAAESRKRIQRILKASNKK